MKIDKNILGALNTVNNNRAVLKLAKDNQPHKAMNILMQIAHNDDSINAQIRIQDVCEAFNLTDIGFDGNLEITLKPNKTSQKTALQIAKANLLYIKSPVGFFKLYLKKQGIQKALHWLIDYNTDINNKNRIKNVKAILKQLHIFDFGDSYSYTLSTDTWKNEFDCDDFLIVTKQGSTKVMPDNANDGTGDTGAFVSSIAPTFRRINSNDVKKLIKLLEENK